MSPPSANAVKRLGLGTVQFGIDYGVTNSRGQVEASQAHAILDLARESGCTLLDTASQYGDAEAILGARPVGLHGFEIVTKSPVISGDKVTASDTRNFERRLRRSLARLRVDRVHGLMVHHGGDLLKPGGDRLIGALRELQGIGLVHKIGFSAYDQFEVEAILEKFTPDIVQLPLNIVDQRLIASEFLRELQAHNVEIHVRSIFLQGLLLQELSQLPDFFVEQASRLREIDDRALSLGLCRMDACLMFVAQRREIGRFIVGVTSPAEFVEIVESLRRIEGKEMDFKGLGIDDVGLLNPSMWPR